MRDALAPSPFRPLSERGILIVLLATIALNGLIALRDKDYSPRVAEITAAILLSLTSLSGAKKDDL